MPDATRTALAGKVTFPELGALIDYAQLFIGVDPRTGAYCRCS
ncbi:hypothetical protein ACNKHX_22330 [Shigella flexneri]